MRIRTYSELRRMRTFEERFEYLRLDGQVGDPTFGSERYINQRFYTSKEWRDIRSEVITRDIGMDLGIDGREIYDRIVIHHMNPMTPAQIAEGSAAILDPEFLITTCHTTHNAIHFGDFSLVPQDYVERKPGDTKLW